MIRYLILAALIVVPAWHGGYAVGRDSAINAAITDGEFTEAGYRYLVRRVQP